MILQNHMTLGISLQSHHASMTLSQIKRTLGKAAFIPTPLHLILSWKCFLVILSCDIFRKTDVLPEYTNLERTTILIQDRLFGEEVFVGIKIHQNRIFDYR